MTGSGSGSAKRSMRASFFLWSAFLLRHQTVAAQEAPTTLEEAQTLWLSLTKGAPSNYTFEYLENSSAHPNAKDSYVIDVRQDVVTQVYSQQAGLPASGGSLDPAAFPTVPDLFATIEEAQNTTTTEASAKYNAKYGYPTSISISYNSTDHVEIEVPSMTPYTILGYELDMNEALWDSYDESKDDYWFVESTMCFCSPDYVTPKLIVVQNDTVVSTTDLATGAPSAYNYDTIPQLFRRIQTSIDHYDVQILVSYDKVLGYPSSISTNPAYGIADASVSISVSNVTLGAFENWERTEPPVAVPTASPSTRPPTNATPPQSQFDAAPTGQVRRRRPLRGRFCFGILKASRFCKARHFGN